MTDNVFFQRFREASDRKYDRELGKLSAKSGVPYSTIGAYRQGKMLPTLPNLIALADALDVSLDWLTGRK